MSVALMSLAFKAAVPSTQKLVLLALCDSANDQGECYPSVSVLVGKCSLSERAIQDAIAALERGGFLHREFRIGRSTTYWMTPATGAPHPRAKCTPAVAAPPQEMHPTPADPAPPPPQLAHPTPATGAPITIKETSIEPSRKQKKAPESVALPVLLDAGFDESTALEFIAHKARLKAPLTERAWLDHRAESVKAGWTPQEAAEKVMARNWKGFEAKYVANDPRPTGQAPPHADRKSRQLTTAALMTGSAKSPTQPIEFVEVIDANRNTNFLAP